jgi:hypothetical protein
MTGDLVLDRAVVVTFGIALNADRLHGGEASLQRASGSRRGTAVCLGFGVIVSD